MSGISEFNINLIRYSQQNYVRNTFI